MILHGLDITMVIESNVAPHASTIADTSAGTMNFATPAAEVRGHR